LMVVQGFCTLARIDPTLVSGFSATSRRVRQPQLRDAVAGAAQDNFHCRFVVHSDGDSATQDLRKLLADCC
jgi:hypothetical protein